MSDITRCGLTRRSFLRLSALGAAGAGAIALVGCGSDSATKTATSTRAPSAPASTPLPTAAVALRGSWARVETPGPGPLRDHSLTANPDDGRLYLFGGRSAGVSSNDLWIFDPVTSAWQRAVAGGDAPGARFGHDAVYDRARRRLVVALGQLSEGSFYDDVWAYDGARWQQLGASSPDRPEIRYGAGAALDAAGDRLVISHGFTDRGRFSDTWAFDFQKDAWAQIKTSGDVPIKRCLTRCLWLPASESMLMFGGQTDDNPYLGDLWTLDAKARAWTEQHPAVLPGPRNLYGAALDATGRRWFVVSGNTPQGAIAETWSYDLASATWSMLDATGGPLTPRYSSDAAIIGSDLFVYGGHDDSGDLADTWKLTLSI